MHVLVGKGLKHPLPFSWRFVEWIIDATGLSKGQGNKGFEIMKVSLGELTPLSFLRQLMDSDASQS